MTSPMASSVARIYMMCMSVWNSFWIGICYRVKCSYFVGRCGRATPPADLKGIGVPPAAVRLGVQWRDIGSLLMSLAFKQQIAFDGLIRYTSKFALLLFKQIII